MEATENICCVKSESAVAHCWQMVWEILLWLQELWQSGKIK